MKEIALSISKNTIRSAVITDPSTGSGNGKMTSMFQDPDKAEGQKITSEAKPVSMTLRILIYNCNGKPLQVQ